MKTLSLVLSLLLCLVSSANAQMYSTSKILDAQSRTATTITAAASTPDTILVIAGSGIQFDTITVPFYVKCTGQKTNYYSSSTPVAATKSEVFQVTYVSGDTLVLGSRALFGSLQQLWPGGSTIQAIFEPAYSKQLQDSAIANHILLDSIFKGTPAIAGALTIKGTTNQVKLGAAAHLLTISSTPPAAASQTYTLPDAGGAASFVLTGGTQTIGGSTTFTLAVPISAVSNQLVLGTTNTTTISATAPSSSRTYTMPDVGANANILLSSVGALNVVNVINTADTTTTGQSLVGTPLQFAVGTSQKWIFDCYIRSGTSSSAGVKVGVDIPASATMLVQAFGSTTGVTAYSSDLMTADATAGLAFNTVAAQTGIIHLHGSVTTAGTGGSVIIQFLQVTSGTATIAANSYIHAERVQ